MNRTHHAGPAMFEPLEARQLMSASPLTVLYTETNSPETGQNAVLAFQRDAATGALSQIGKFLTHGTGQANPQQAIGPDDSDQEVVASPDGRFVFAVNQGSNSITTFRVARDGSLDRVGTFDSGGVQPVSLGLAGDRLYVANRGDVSTAHAGTVVPNYTAFRVRENGTLKPIDGSTVALPVGVSPSQTLISNDGRFVFGDNFAVPGTSPALGNTIEPFQIGHNGKLELASGGPVGTTGVTPGLLLGITTHPTQRILYAGLVGASKIGVFTYDNAGALTFVGSVSDQGAGPCWVTVSPDGKYLYAANTGSDSVAVYSLADPQHPVQVQDFKLAGPFAPPGAPASERDTAAFELALDPTGKSLYVIDQTTAANHNFQQGNAVHVLAVAGDGTVSEAVAPVLFSPNDVSANARPQGLALVKIDRHDRGDNDDGEHRGGDAALFSTAASATSSAFSTTPIWQSIDDVV